MRFVSIMVLITVGVACGPPTNAQNRTTEWSGERAQGCVQDSDCAANQICLAEFGRCKSVERADCNLEAGEFCACASDAECPDGAYCNGEGLCELNATSAPNPVPPPQRCLQNADCAADQLCVDGACVGQATPECRTDRQCPGGQRCVEAQCVEGSGCRSDLDCDAQQICRDTACITVACRQDSDCAGETRCQDNQCITPPAEDDHGDTLDTATRVEDYSTTRGVLNTNDDVDVFVFRSSIRGTYRAETTGASDTLCTFLDANGGELANNDDDGDNLNCRLETVLERGVTVYLRVAGFEGRTGAYTMVLRRPELPQPDDHGNDLANATSVSDNSVTAGRIEQAGDRDYFVFETTASTNYTLYTTSNRDTHCSLFDSNGQLLAQDEGSGLGGNCRIAEALTGGQRYGFLVRHSSPVGTGAYTLRFERSTRDQDDQSDERRNAQMVQLPARIETRLETRDRDWFSFTTGVAGVYRMETQSGLDTFCRLEDAQGTQLATDDDDGQGINCGIEIHLSAAETYFFMVRGYTSNITGDYVALIEKR